MNFGRIATKALGMLGTQVDAKLRRAGASAHLPSAGAPAPVAPLLYDCICVISSDVSEFDENLVRGGDMGVLISAEDIEIAPLEGDTFLFANNVFKVIKVNSTYTGEYVAAMFNLLVRK